MHELMLLFASIAANFVDGRTGEVQPSKLSVLSRWQREYTIERVLAEIRAYVT
jgi:ubiquitin-protein ligase